MFTANLIGVSFIKSSTAPTNTYSTCSMEILWSISESGKALILEI